MNQLPDIFDQKQLARNRVRAARNYAQFDFLHREMATRLAERLDDTTRTLPHALALGCAALTPEALLKGRAGIERVSLADVVEPDFRLPEATYDVIFAPHALSAVNDVPGAFIQLRRALKPDGLLLVMVYGGQTLRELREALGAAEMEITGGMSPHIAPTVDVRDAGNLLARAGFALPVADAEVVQASYETMFHLMHDLQGMGEGNVLIHRRKTFSRRDVFWRAATLYEERFATEDGRVPASFELVALTAWAPHESQQQPAKRGSGKINLNDALKS